MASAPVWKPSAAVACWQTVAPRAASACLPRFPAGRRKRPVSTVQDFDRMASSATRLKRRAEFLRVASKGRKAPMPGLVLQALARDDTAPARLGFTVTKKVGNAVIRNRTRRRLREAAQVVIREHAPSGVDLVLIGRDGTRKRNFRALIDDIARAMRKAGVPLVSGRP